jgi:hypothetical protein
MDISAFIEKRIAKQLWLPFIDYYEMPQEKEDTVILFHLPRMSKQKLTDQAKLEGLSVTGLLNRLITDCITGKVQQIFKPKTGRGHKVEGVENKAKELLREKHPKTVRLVEIAKYCDVSQARAARIVDNLSGNLTDGEYEFLVYTDDDGSIGIFRDDKLGI